MFAKKQFYFRPQDIEAQQEFLSYPRGKHDDVMDAVWTALDSVKPCRVKQYDENSHKKTIQKKLLDWMTM
jgi:phage terminase large subunit-like protein